MATIPSSSQMSSRRFVRAPVVLARARAVPAAGLALAQSLAHLGQVLFGVLLLLVGGALLLTLWLLPVAQGTSRISRRKRGCPLGPVLASTGSRIRGRTPMAAATEFWCWRRNRRNHAGSQGWARCLALIGWQVAGALV
jgi:hypothetical protein